MMTDKKQGTLDIPTKNLPHQLCFDENRDNWYKKYATDHDQKHTVITIHHVAAVTPKKFYTALYHLAPT